MGEALGRALNKGKSGSQCQRCFESQGKENLKKGIDYKEVHAHVLINQSGLLLPVYAGGFSI